jgi:hypothetical protein
MAGKRFRYWTNCVGTQDAQGIIDMVDEAKQITWKTFSRHVNIDEIKRLFPDYSYRGEYLGPDGMPTAPMHLKDDYTVSFWKSRYRGRLCYYLVHSGIEYIFLC